MSTKVSNPAGLAYAGNGPSVNDDGTPMLNRTRRIVGGGSDTTGLTAGYTGVDVQGTDPAGAVMGPNRSAGENSGTGFAAT